MRGTGSLTLAAALALAASTGCSTTGHTTEFRVYDLGEMHGGTLDDDETKVFVAMIRDAVGPDIWFETGSTIHVLDEVLTVRTTPDGHLELGRFFSRFRLINEHR